MTGLLVAFLAVHGLLHLAIWLPRPQPDEAPPFHPDHSAVLTAAHTPTDVVRGLSLALAAVTAAAYVIAAALVGFDAAWSAPAVLVAALLGLLLKGLYFHPWLLLGIALDGLVLSAAVTGWPISPT